MEPLCAADERWTDYVEGIANRDTKIGGLPDNPWWENVNSAGCFGQHPVDQLWGQ